MTGYQLFAVTSPLITAGVAIGTAVIAKRIFVRPRFAEAETAESPAYVDVGGHVVSQATIGETIEARKSSFRNLVIHEADALAARIIEGADHIPGTIGVPKETIRSK